MTCRQRLLWGLVLWLVPLTFAGTAGMQAWFSNAAQDDMLDALEKRQKFLLAMVTDPNHGYIAIDEHGHVFGWSKALENWTGWKREEMLGKSLEHVMPAQQWAAHHSKYDLSAADKNDEGQTYQLKCQILHRDAAVPPLDVIVTARTARLADPVSGEREFFGIATVDKAGEFRSLVPPDELQPPQ
jgi:PAS domain S-box-containing protein